MLALEHRMLAFQLRDFESLQFACSAHLICPRSYCGADGNSGLGSTCTFCTQYLHRQYTAVSCPILSPFVLYSQVAKIDESLRMRIAMK